MTWGRKYFEMIVIFIKKNKIKYYIYMNIESYMILVRYLFNSKQIKFFSVWLYEISCFYWKFQWEISSTIPSTISLPLDRPMPRFYLKVFGTVYMFTRIIHTHIYIDICIAQKYTTTIRTVLILTEASTGIDSSKAFVFVYKKYRLNTHIS